MYDDAKRMTLTATPNAQPLYRVGLRPAAAACARESVSRASVIRRMGPTTSGRGSRPSVRQRRERYTYDAFGNRASMTDASGATNYSYDDAGRLMLSLRRERAVTPPSPASAISYTSDNNVDLTARGSDSFGWDFEDRISLAFGALRRMHANKRIAEPAPASVVNRCHQALRTPPPPVPGSHHGHPRARREHRTIGTARGATHARAIALRQCGSNAASPRAQRGPSALRTSALEARWSALRAWKKIQGSIRSSGSATRRLNLPNLHVHGRHGSAI
jgi:RHS Repeat